MLTIIFNPGSGAAPPPPPPQNLKWGSERIRPRKTVELRRPKREKVQFPEIVNEGDSLLAAHHDAVLVSIAALLASGVIQ